MAEKKIQFRKKRELGDIITDSFEFIKQEYKPIGRLILIYVLPFALIYGFVQVNVQTKIMGIVDFSDPKTVMANIGPVYFNVFISALFSLFVQSLLAGTYFSYLEAYIKKGKGNFELSDITPNLFSNTLLALGASLVTFVIVLIGVILCIVPGIYFANTFSIVVIIALFEKKGIAHAFTRSWNLVNRQWWNTFLLNLLGVVLIWFIGFVISIPSMISGVSTSLFSLKEIPAIEQPTWYWVIIGLSTVVSSLCWVIPYTFLAFQYFNLNEINKSFQPPK